jgi:hypothetical protein
MYGFFAGAKKSIAKSRTKANSAAAANTMPAQLSQFWKWRLNDRGCVGLVASGIAAIIYTRREKSHRNNPGIASVVGVIEIGSERQIRFCA